MALTPAQLQALVAGVYEYQPYDISEMPVDAEFFGAVVADNMRTNNSPFGGIDLQQVKSALPFINKSTGMIDKEFVVGYFPPFSPSEGGFEAGYCKEDADSITLKQVSFKFGTPVRTSAKVEGGYCEAGSKEFMDYQVRRQATIRRLVARHLQALVDTFNRDFFSRYNEFVGNMPRLTNTSPARTPGEALPLFHNAPAGYSPPINIKGTERLRQDVRRARVPQQTYTVGSAFVQGYEQALRAQGAFRQDGYNPSAIAAMRSPLNSLVPSDSIAYFTGLRGAMMVVPSGYIKAAFLAIESPQYGRQGNFGTQTRTTIVDPVFGIEHDFVTDLKTCGETVDEIFTITTRYAIIAMPKCDNNTPALEGVNGIMLYDATCSNDTFCDSEIEGFVNPILIGKDAVCDELQIDQCLPVCSVVLQLFRQTDTSLILQAIAQGAQGSTSITYAWQVAGAPVAETSDVLTVALADLTDGDLIEVTITDSTGCTIKAPYTYNV